ncbi:GNAT family N-acetyltransferase [Actinomycetaceae bacterium TAE3-ERU4]|nr:GNAT family N-acetyltransferase [Actinomycetaceae bacterium TAE3-ERU4]
MTKLAERLNVCTPVPLPPAHLGLRWEELKAVHAPSLVRLIRASQISDGAISFTSDAEIADMIEGVRGRTLISSIVGVDSKGEVQAIATVHIPTGAKKNVLASLEATVSPTWRRRGIGRVLLSWQDQTARALILEKYGPDSNVKVTIGGVVHGNNPSARSLFVAAGYTPERTFDVMYADLNSPLVSYPLAEGYLFAPWPTGKKLEEVRDLHLGAFEDHWGDRTQYLSWWEDALANLDARWSSIVLDSKGEIAGYCAIARPVTKWMLTGVKELYAELIGVNRKHRGQGLARAMLSKAVFAAREDGMERFGLDVDIDNPSSAAKIYASIGFETQRSFTYYSVDL